MLPHVADVLFTLKVIVSVPLAVQLRITVVPSIALTETGSTRKTKLKLPRSTYTKYMRFMVIAMLIKKGYSIIHNHQYIMQSKM